MSEDAVADPGEPERKGGFTLPSAYTILFILIVLAAIATWIIPAGTYDLNDAGEPRPGTYHEVDAKPSRIVVDSLTAPINGLFGIEDDEGNINYYNSGTLFGAIDIALFIIVIGGFLGVTMKSGAIQAGIGSLVQRMKDRERWMIPVLMCVFALGGTSYGMAEESLAFYVLVISVMIATSSRCRPGRSSPTSATRPPTRSSPRPASRCSRSRARSSAAAAAAATA